LGELLIGAWAVVPCRRVGREVIFAVTKLDSAADGLLVISGSLLGGGAGRQGRNEQLGPTDAAVRARLMMEAPWLRSASECRQFGHPPPLNNCAVRCRSTPWAAARPPPGDIRVLGEIMGSQKCRHIGESQSVLMMTVLPRQRSQKCRHIGESQSVLMMTALPRQRSQKCRHIGESQSVLMMTALPRQLVEPTELPGEGAAAAAADGDGGEGESEGDEEVGSPLLQPPPAKKFRGAGGEVVTAVTARQVRLRYHLMPACHHQPAAAQPGRPHRPDKQHKKA
jgi:hypothetical protein